MDDLPILPAGLTDEEHKRIVAPGFIRRRDKQGEDQMATAKAERVAAIMDENRELSLVELENARNRALRMMVRRFYEMKPQEVISAVGVLDGEIATKRMETKTETASAQATREEMIRSLKGKKADA